MIKEMKNVKILSTGKYVPKHIVSNYDLSRLVNTNDDWIYSRTGINERRISDGENTAQIATKAALDAIITAGISAEEIDLIIVATCTPDNFLPSTACLVQANIGAINATCFDLSAACTGFIYALNTATQFIKTGQSKLALVIGAEVLSKIVDWTDRNTCVLFGDGAGAVILTESKEEGIISIYTKSEGVKGSVLSCKALEVGNPFVKLSEKNRNYIFMEGGEVFKFAVRAMQESIETVLTSSVCSINDIKFIVSHQANKRIIDSCSKKMKIDVNKFYKNIERYGNTSSASIPIAFDEVVKNRLIERGDKIILVGFGGGLTWGATLVSF